MTRGERVSVVIPVGDEAGTIGPLLRGLEGSLGDLPHEILRPDGGPGAGQAPRAAFRSARGDVVVVVAPGFSGDTGVIPAMVERVRGHGADVVAPSGTGGRSPWKKALLHLTGYPTLECTSGLRAYRAGFLRNVEVEGRWGPEIDLELLVKAHRRGGRIDEVPLTRTGGGPNPRRPVLRCLRWYVTALWEGGRPEKPHPVPWTVLILVVGLLWMRFVDLPSLVADVGLEPSWNQVLAHAAAHSLSAGEDILFTYGPLGWILSYAYQPEVFGARVVADLLLKLFAVVCLARAAFDLRGRWTQVLLLVLAAAFLKAETLFLVTLFLVGRDLCSGRMPPWKEWAALAVLVAISLMKLTLCLFAGSAVCVAAIVRWRRSARLVAGAAVLWLGMWLMSGQAISGIPSYLRGGLDLVAGYSEAMSLDLRPMGEVRLGAALLALWVLSILLGALRRPLARHLGPGVLSLLLALLVWKHGFVRQDLHSLGFFMASACLPLLSWPRDDRHAPRRLLRRSLLAACVASSCWMIHAIGLESERGIGETPHRVYESIRQNVRRLAHLGAERERLEAERRQRASRHALPEIRGIIGDGTVDMLTANEQGVILLNDLTYRPRPVFQSYSAFTPYLIRRNAAHFSDPEGPDHVIFKPASIDNHYPGMEDGLALMELLRRYAPVLDEGGYLLLERREAPPSGTGAPLLERTVGWGEPVDLRELSGRILVLSLDIRYSLTGTLRKSVFRAPAILLNVSGPGGDRTFRIVPGMTRTGFVIQPLLLDVAGFLSCYLPPSDRLPLFRVDTLSVSPARPGHSSLFEDRIRLRVTELPGDGVQPVRPDDWLRRGPFALLDGVPLQRGTPDSGCIISLPGEGWALFAHAPSRIAWTVPPGSRGVSVSYGVIDGAYREPGRTDGVEFRIMLEGAVLWSRLLDPVGRPGDRGTQAVDLEIGRTVPEGSRIILETLRGPDEDPSWDWAYWAGIEFTTGDP